MSIDVHRLLWQQLSKMYGNDDNSMFVLTMGKYLNFLDYSPTNLREAGHNTFELVNSCISCNVNYSPTGSRISIQWEQLLYQGKGPPATDAQRPAFEKARDLLYTNYKTREPTELYKKYLKATAALAKKKVELMRECQQKYGNNWEAFYKEMLPATEEYQQFQFLDREVSPLLQAIDEWIYGPLANVMAPMKKAFKDNERSAVLRDGKSNTYYCISMIPTNWYQWFDPDQPEDESWINIIVDEHTPDDANQSKKYKRLSGMPNAPLEFVTFLQIRGEGVQEKKIDIGDSRDVKIFLKVRSVQINRPWVDLSALKIEHWKIPGQGPSSWSTGILDSSNNGSFPLLSNRMIVARDIKITASEFSKEIVNTLKMFNPSVESAVLCGLFSYSPGRGYSKETYDHKYDERSYTPGRGYSKETHGLKYDERSNSIILDGTQVIGYACTLLPKYPA